MRISEELGIVDTNELVVQMEKLKIKYLLYNNKHDAYNEIIKMVDILFDKMNIKVSSQKGMKAVIDYIERNLRENQP
ncbi:MAG: hypothetical protein ACLTY8_14760 [Lachnospiraceae bacterium]